MYMIDIPRYKKIVAETIIFDLNGTLAIDGKVDREVLDMLNTLNKKYKIVILTADTFGTVKRMFNEYNNITVEIINTMDEKTQVAKRYSPYIAIGNGNNDVDVFKNSELSIAIMNREGCSTKALFSADVVVNNIIDAIGLLLNEKRLIATLRE